jgi:uncharacterized membrane protein YeaQ/YmgE (transglycosylase-associated protein family)
MSSGPRQQHPRNYAVAAARARIFFSRTRTGAGTTLRLKDSGTRGDFASGRALLSVTDYRVTYLITGFESLWVFIAWIVPGLAAGLIANMLIPGRGQRGLILTCVIGIVGALGGGWAATKIFHINSLQAVSSGSAWTPRPGRT